MMFKHTTHTPRDSGLLLAGLLLRVAR